MYRRSVAVSTIALLSLIVFASGARFNGPNFPDILTYGALFRRAEESRRVGTRRVRPSGSETLNENYGATRVMSEISLGDGQNRARAAVACATDVRRNVSRVSSSSSSSSSCSLPFPSRSALRLSTHVESSARRYQLIYDRIKS